MDKAAVLASLCVLCFSCRGYGQATNLTLFQITPCTGVKVDTVSRFKSDIYAVVADVRNCTNVSLAEDHKIGFRVMSWANISIADYKDGQDPVVFIGRQGNSGVISWSIPFQPQGFTRYFHHVYRTMCPSNITVQEIDDTAVLQEAEEFLFYIDVFSSSVDPVQYSIAIETVPEFILKLDEPITFTVGASSPQIHYFEFPDDVSTVTIEATTDSDRCAFVSVQNNTCPINDLLENACSRGIYQTMSTSAFLTVEASKVINREFVLVIITANYSICHGFQYAPLERIRHPNESILIPEDFVYAQDITVVVRKLKPTSKFALAIIFPFLVFLFYLFLVCLYIFALPRIFLHFERSPCCCHFHWTWKFPWTRKCTMTSFLSGSVQTYSSIEGGNTSSGVSIQSLVGDSKDIDSTTTGTSTPIEESLRSIREPDEGKLMLPLMYTRKYTKLNKQYTIYSWNTITVGIFYALPAFQLVLSEQQSLNTSGNQDKCYFNFKCSHPLGVLSVFNSVWSNVGYFLLGFLFLVLVSLRKHVYMKHILKTHRHYTESHGIPEFYGIYQAMGIALILEGFMSAFYHICPTDANFQFDTAFMFIIGGLFLVKIFQNRHPDINANAFIAFFSFAVVIFTTLIGIYLDRRNPVAIRITIFIFVIVLVSIFFFSFYRFHSWKWESLKREIGDFRRYFCTLPHHRCRFSKLCLVFTCNLVLALIVVVAHEEIDIATSILGFFVVNLMLFLLIYIVQKFYYLETITLLPVFLAAGVIALWACAFYFFIIKASTNWELTPAESRAKNSPCILLDFYDSHDVWHFFSASSMFFSFLFLLTLDDGLQNTNRGEIHVF